VSLLWRYQLRGGLVTGQGVLGRDCAWCGLPAVGELEVQPAQYRTVSRRDPVSGARTTHQQFERSAVVVAVCGTHEHITRRQPGPVAIARQRTARDVQQLGLFAATAQQRLGNAIGGETTR
jgi:hypothetical protein